MNNNNNNNNNGGEEECLQVIGAKARSNESAMNGRMFEGG
jgi:hypothetical protein